MPYSEDELYYIESLWPENFAAMIDDMKSLAIDQKKLIEDARRAAFTGYSMPYQTSYVYTETSYQKDLSDEEIERRYLKNAKSKMKKEAERAAAKTISENVEPPKEQTLFSKINFDKGI